MHILYISQYFPPEMGAPAARVYELSREWVRMGHRVTVLTGFPNHPTGVVPPEYRGRAFERETTDGIEVVRTWLYAAPNRDRARRILNYLSFPASAIVLGAPSIRGADVVIGTSPQFLVAVAGWVVAAVKRRPFIFEVRDLWPDSIEAVGAIHSRTILGALRAVEEFLYRRATRIVAVARSTPRILAERGFDPRKMAVIPNGVDLDLFEPGSHDNEFRRRHVPAGSFVVSYIGTHGMAHALDSVLRTAHALRDDPRFRFLLVGEGAEKPKLLAQAAELGCDNVVFLDQQPRGTLPEIYRASDVCLVPLRKTPLFQAVLPSKMFEIMGCGRPIVLSVEGEAKELLAESGAGVAVEPESVDALAAALRTLAADPARTTSMGEAGRAFVEAKYSRTALARDYIEVLRAVVLRR
jgi:colanic acid biosynthesis glycosyl transferase WcaI